MGERIGGKIFHGIEPVTPEERALAEEGMAEIERWYREKAERGEAPERKPVSGRFGRDDFEGTEYEQWAREQWAEEDARGSEEPN
ncbi:MAG: hypothetical protein J2P18_12735 [Nocardia sp.]|nr:hypothetical protein [Nocardia sp.]